MNDLISRQAAIDATCHNCSQNGICDGKCDDTDRLRDLPAIEPKRGEWIAEPNCWYRCSNCGQHYPSMRGYMDYKYCPNCGAEMEVNNLLKSE